MWEKIKCEKPTSGQTGDYPLIANLFFGVILLIVIPLIFGYIIIPIIAP